MSEGTSSSGGTASPSLASWAYWPAKADFAASPAATWLRAVSSWLCSLEICVLEARGLLALGRDHQHPARDDRANREHDDDHHAVAGGHWVPPGVVVVVEAAPTEVTPDAPAFATG